ncbi:MAG: response regulator [Verrucomicrobia bacterium]|nr:response regulator [Verrucomicrobiota bacterium]MCF7707751.1 response regulator [Verrucomicrobiota bacterium]
MHQYVKELGEANASIDILLVEDSENDAELALHVLGSKLPNAKVVVAEDGEEALDIMLAHGKPNGEDRVSRPKVIFLDLKLPKIDGKQVLRALKSDNELRNTPVVILSSSKEERDVRDAYALGANSYVVKPLDFKEYMNALTILGEYWLKCNQTLEDY